MGSLTRTHAAMVSRLNTCRAIDDPSTSLSHLRTTCCIIQSTAVRIFVALINDVTTTVRTPDLTFQLSLLLLSSNPSTCLDQYHKVRLGTFVSFIKAKVSGAFGNNQSNFVGPIAANHLLISDKESVGLSGERSSLSSFIPSEHCSSQIQDCGLWLYHHQGTNFKSLPIISATSFDE